MWKSRQASLVSWKFEVINLLAAWIEVCDWFARSSEHNDFRAKVFCILEVSKPLSNYHSQHVSQYRTESFCKTAQPLRNLLRRRSRADNKSGTPHHYRSSLAALSSRCSIMFSRPEALSFHPNAVNISSQHCHFGRFDGRTA